MKILCFALAVITAILPHSLVKGACRPVSPLTNRTGTVEHPKAEKGDECMISIKVGDQAPKFISLTMFNILLSTGGKLEIYDGAADNADTLLYNISSSSLPQQIGITFSNDVNIKYTVGDLKTIESWNISYASDECEPNVPNTWVKQLESPKHLPVKDKSFSCTYTVTSRLPTQRIPVVSMQLGLTSKSSLELTNAQSKAMYTDKTPAEDFFATDTASPIEVVFTVDNASTMPTFSLLVEPVMKDCSGRYNLTEVQTILFTVPADHPAQYNCRYLVVASSDTAKVLAEVTSLSLVEGNDVISFLDTRSSSSTGKVLTTMSTNPTPGFLVATTSNSLLITLSLGNAEGERKMEFKISPLENGGRFTGSGKIAAGKAKKEDADETITAYFQLLATTGKVVSTNVVTALPENATVSFYNGLQQNSDNLIITFSSETDNMEMVPVIAGPEMLVVLKTFPSTDNFTATFDSIEPGCDMLLTGASGQLTFSNDASFNGTETCTFTVYPFNADEGTLVLNFDSITVGEKESVAISSADGLVAEFDSTISHAAEIYVSESPMTRIVIMNGGDEKTHTSLSGRYSVKADVCGGKLPSESSDIVTPNYPNQYPLNADCTWTMPGSDAPSTDFLYMNFKSLDLATGHFINISDMNNKSSEQLASFAGCELPDDFIVPVTTGLNVNFQSKAQNTGVKNQVAGGAQISYMVLSCGGNMSSGKGNFKSPDYPEDPKDSSTCVWIIEAAQPDPKKNGTNIVSMNITLADKSAKALPSSLVIYDGASMRNKTLTHKNFTKGMSGQILSRYNKVVIKYTYQKKAGTNAKAAFSLLFDTYKCNSSQLCDNGICLHPDWKCNNVDDCGDFTDERGCKPSPSPKPKPSDSSDTSGYVKGGYVALLFFIALILGAVLVLVVPKIIRKLRGGGGSYSRMHDSAPVVT